MEKLPAILPRPAGMPLADLSPRFAEQAQRTPAARWTRYGRWDEAGKRVYGERGNVIYGG